ncbi:hypothetical protein L7F22_044830 [Adiantum nelumboides]|nr:hypothetical protein [Adiantum nelumboides]
MVFTAILTAHSMAGEEQLVYHDFLGIARHRGESVNLSDLQVLDAPKRDLAEELVKQEGAMNSAMRKTLSAEQSAWPQGSCTSALPVYHKPESIVRQGRQRESGGSREFSPGQLQMVADAPETSPHLKVSRFEMLDEKRSGHVEACRDLIMQPQPTSSNLQTSQPSIAVKPSLRAVSASRWDNSWHLASNCYTVGSEQLGLRNPQLDKLAPSIRETSGIVPTAPADEGSRTGLKGSSAGILRNGVSTNLVSGATHNNLTLGKPWSLSAGSESTQQATAPTSRQLTIFYGGQAHVFDDVPSDKAEAIMTLAGSSGRSWSTMFTPRSNDYVPGFKNGLLESFVDGERSTISKASAVDCGGQIASEVLPTLHNSHVRFSKYQVLRNSGNPSISVGREMPELPRDQK